MSGGEHAVGKEPGKGTRTLEYLKKTCRERVMLIDGAMGTMVQRFNFTEEQVRGERFLNHPKDVLRGNNEMLSLTQPEAIMEIHRRYLIAGADMIETNTFSGTTIAQADYLMEEFVYEMNKISAEIAKKVCDEITVLEPNKPRFVVGAIGPTNKTASISPSPRDPSFRDITFDELVAAYIQQVEGLLDGGADILMVETIFDTLNAKAALYAIDVVVDEKGYDRVPVFISGTIVDQSGRTLSGQTSESFVTSLRNSNPFAIGVNCAMGADQMLPFIQNISKLTDTFTICYPNAGLPNTFREYEESPDQMAKKLVPFAELGFVNIVGGCCGTTPEHIKAIYDAIKGIKPRIPPTINRDSLLVCGLETYRKGNWDAFCNVGQRCNISRSSIFAKSINTDAYEAALAIARAQIVSGAQIIDVNMDGSLIDSKIAMIKFLNYIATDPIVAKVSIMIDSSNFDVIVAGLKSIQGKAIVNSISLKDGKEAFVQKAKIIKRFGAAVIVLAIDENGFSCEPDRKFAACKRAYDILVQEIGFHPADIIFDPVITRLSKDDSNCAVEVINICLRIKTELPRAKICGGVSNLSISFKGKQLIRRALHAVFLLHATKAGMGLGIVNTDYLSSQLEIPKDLVQLCEDLIWNRKPTQTTENTEI
ncbi:hypothetical protein HK100_001577 [Physocladia obscura]|uniref:methionine synthase n=1 Tax=Physocladia obscura TaxID=109957 RepID=A0AAD5XBQ3_9FUNG|nr:hypothetical protein HK100_001577 [Physocladia obscura]